MKLLEDIDLIIEQLHTLQARSINTWQAKEIYAIRRQLEEARNDYIKQGDRIKISKPFEIICKECQAKQLRTEDYYVHLRKQHNYQDQDASTEATDPLRNYEAGITQLNNLLTEFTEARLEENHYG
jgi:hypothetical protein